MHWMKALGLRAVLAWMLGAAALAGAQPAEIGVNLDGVADWMSSAAYIDATAYFRRWGKPGAGWEEQPGLQLTAENLPLGDADAISYLHIQHFKITFKKPGRLIVEQLQNIFFLNRLTICCQHAADRI